MAAAYMFYKRLQSGRINFHLYRANGWGGSLANSGYVRIYVKFIQILHLCRPIRNGGDCAFSQGKRWAERY